MKQTKARTMYSTYGYPTDPRLRARFRLDLRRFVRRLRG